MFQVIHGSAKNAEKETHGILILVKVVELIDKLNRKAITDSLYSDEF
jgi:hypothetical protein